MHATAPSQMYLPLSGGLLHATNPTPAMTGFANRHKSTPIYMYNAYAVSSPTMLWATHVFVQSRQIDCSVKTAVPPLAIMTMLQVVFTSDVWLGRCTFGPGSLSGKHSLQCQAFHAIFWQPVPQKQIFLQPACTILQCLSTALQLAMSLMESNNSFPPPFLPL